VEENETINKEKLQEEYNDAYWEGHYTICRERIPVFLEQVANKILNTGKYLNVVRLCGKLENTGKYRNVVRELENTGKYLNVVRLC
jgi:gamma-tubulin complex component 2